MAAMAGLARSATSCGRRITTRGGSSAPGSSPAPARRSSRPPASSPGSSSGIWLAASSSEPRVARLELDAQLRRIERRVPVVVVPAGDRSAVARVPAGVQRAVGAVPADSIAADAVARAGVVGLVPDVEPDVRSRSLLAVNDIVEDRVLDAAGDEDPDLADVEERVVAGDAVCRAAVAEGDSGS